jgi:hypothetical protein
MMLHRVISFLGMGRVTIKRLPEDASRDGRILRIPRKPGMRT